MEPCTSGGSTLYIESILKKAIEASSDGKPPQGSMELTGHLGDVMKESAAIAYTFAKSFLAKMAADNDFLQTANIHVHIPEVNVPIVLYPAQLQSTTVNWPPTISQDTLLTSYVKMYF